MFGSAESQCATTLLADLAHAELLTRPRTRRYRDVRISIRSPCRGIHRYEGVNGHNESDQSGQSTSRYRRTRPPPARRLRQTVRTPTPSYTSPATSANNPCGRVKGDF